MEDRRYKILVAKSEGNRPPRRTGLKIVSNIRMNLTEIR
jgi:hypothetical protein